MDFTKLLEYGPVAAIAGVLLWMLANQLKQQNELMKAQLQAFSETREKLLIGQEKVFGALNKMSDDVEELAGKISGCGFRKPPHT